MSVRGIEDGTRASPSGEAVARSVTEEVVLPVRAYRTSLCWGEATSSDLAALGHLPLKGKAFGCLPAE